MSRNHLVSALLAAAFALTACGGGSPSQGLLPASGGMQQQSSALALQPSFGLGPDNGYYRVTQAGGARPLCPAVAGSKAWRCYAWLRTDLHPSLTQIAAGSKGIPSGIGFTPADIQSAYHLDPSKGSGQTVYIIDAYGYKNVSKDLTLYRAAAGLSACGKGCFTVLNQEGKTKPLPSEQLDWAGEQSLDVDAVSASCPKCKIVLIQTDNNGTLQAGIVEAVTLGGKIVSMSFGGSEGGPADAGLPAAGYAFVASAGDDGGGPCSACENPGGASMPCAYAAVVCVGGTALTHKGSAWSETTWNDEQVNECNGPCGATGSACSSVVPKPAWQGSADCKMRGAADVAADASPLTPLAVYNSEACGGWCGIGGTSLAAPLIAGVFGLAGNATTRHGATELWKSHAKLNDVTTGTNVYKPVTGKCQSKVVQVCTAAKGYDGPTGWGTPNTSADF
jgi:subtilase family serine protease